MSRTSSVRAPAPQANAPAKPRRARRPSLSEAEFLNAALAVFVEKGYEGTSIDAITASAGIAKRTIYARYGDKETLFRAAIEQGIDDWIAPVEQLRAAETEDLEGTLLAVGSILVDNILKPAGLRLLRLTNAVSGRMPTIGEHNVRYGQDPTIAYLTDLFRRRLPEACTARDMREFSEAFLHLVVGGPAIAAAWGVERDREAIERQTRLSVKIFLNGMLNVLQVPQEAAAACQPQAGDQLVAALDEASEKLDFLRTQLQGRSA